MNRKILVLAVTLLALAMLSTPLVGAAMAKKTAIVITRTPGVDPPTEEILEEIPGDTKSPGKSYNLIGSGLFRTVAYGSESDDRGPLGYGTKYVETIFSISQGSGEIVTTPMGDIPMYVNGFGIYKVKYVIEGGPYGVGTLEATERMEWEIDFSDPNPLNWRYEAWSSYSLKQGTGDFAGIRVDLETYFNMWLGFYHTKTAVIY